MVDLQSQYHEIKTEVLEAIQDVIETSSFINGPAVKAFQQELETYMQGTSVIPCANGTDALQLAMMALNLQPGDEVITSPFTFAATPEVIGLLKLTPVFVDIDPDTYNMNPALLEAAITPRTKAIVPVHIFGQCADMEPILALARKHNLYVIEDVAQAIGSTYTFSTGETKMAGSMGIASGTSFFPSKNLGAYGDAGAIFSTDAALTERLRILTNHGQTSTYSYEYIGANSRLDSIQAAVLRIKLKHLESYISSRQQAADFYDSVLSKISSVKIPVRASYTRHVFHQYTFRVLDGQRDNLQKYLMENGVPARVYYPFALHLQKAYNIKGYKAGDFPVAEQLCNEVLSLPMHTELSAEQLEFIRQTLEGYFIAQENQALN